MVSLQKKSPRNILFFKKKLLNKVNLFNKLGINIKNKNILLNNRLLKCFNKEINLLKMKEKQQQDFYLFNDTLKNYRNYRNKIGYPSRGQRTHTNAKTKKKFKK